MSRYNFGPISNASVDLQMAYEGGSTIDTVGGVPVQLDPAYLLQISKPASASRGLNSAGRDSLSSVNVGTATDLLAIGKTVNSGVPVTVTTYTLIVPASQSLFIDPFPTKTVTTDSNSATILIHTFSASLGANIFQVNLFSSYDPTTDTFNGFEVISQPPSNPAYDIVVGSISPISGGFYQVQFSFTAPGTVDLVLSSRLESSQNVLLGF